MLDYRKVTMRVAMDYLKNPEAINTLLKSNGIAVIDGAVVLMKTSPLGGYTSVPWRTLASVDSAIASERFLQDSVSKDLEDYSSLAGSLKTFINVIKGRNVEKIAGFFYKYIANFISSNPRHPDKIQIKNTAKDMDRTIKGSEKRQLEELDFVNLAKLAENMQKTSQSLVTVFEKQLMNSNDRKLALNSLKQLVRENPNALEIMSMVINGDALKAERINPSRVADSVEEAILRRKLIRFMYKGEDGIETERTVQPIKLITLKTGDGLFAFDLKANDYRKFAMERMS